MSQAEQSPNLSCDVLIIGSGAAGLGTALRLPQSMRIIVVSKAGIVAGSTPYAQGGISAVLDEGDTFDAHIRDTLKAGAGLCDEDIVKQTVEAGPECIDWLINLGIEFTREGGQDSSYHLTREGGHSHRRVIHVDDATGKAVADTLIQATLNAPNIQVLEQHLAVDLITDDHACRGAYVLDIEHEHIRTIDAPTVVLATGGASKVYLYSSNPDASTGDGIAMAARAGCQIANMEFMQFHPTCLYHPKARSFLITEAVRGEGGHLLRPDGSRFMRDHDADRMELAPRDVVARAIDFEMKKLGLEHVLLDISFKGADFISKHFPNIQEKCASVGLDMSQEPLPVVPAAHYTCGGVVTNEHANTSIAGLYAVGETAHTGLHGANRMASNSLLECLVFARQAAAHIVTHAAQNQPTHPSSPNWDESRVTNSDEEVVVAHNWLELRRTMWDYVGIVRSNKRLERAQRRIDVLKAETDEYYANFKVTADLLELRNLVQVADLIIKCAQQRQESRGLHYSKDYPDTSDERQDSLITLG